MKLLNHLSLNQKNWVEINDDAREMYNINIQINLKTLRL